MSETMEMPKYKCYKEVWALKIKGISDVVRDGKRLIIPADKGYAPFEVDEQFIKKHSPEVGGYYVVYKDGYKSYSPAKAFKEGYTLISEQ